MQLELDRIPSMTDADSICCTNGNTNDESARITTKILQKVLTSSTCSVVKGPPYFDLPQSSLVGCSFSQYVKALL